MPFLNSIIFVIITLLSVSIPVRADEAPLTAEQAFKISAKALQTDQIELSWLIEKGHYLYSNHIQVTSKTPEVHIVSPVFPEGELKHDDNYGDVSIYREAVILPIVLTKDKAVSSVDIEVHYRGCADRGICYPPQKKLLTIALPPETSIANKTATLNALEQLVTKFPGFDSKAHSDDLIPAEQAFQLFADVKDAHTLHVNWAIAKGYYLYREKVKLQLVNAQGVELGSYAIPRGTPKEDEAFGQVEIFHDELSFDVPLNRSIEAAVEIVLEANFQGCADRGVCYPPMHKSISLSLPAGQKVSQEVLSQKTATAGSGDSEQDRIVQSLHQDSGLAILFSFFGFGLLLSMTPCIFPMIPILSGIIVGHGNHINTRRAILLSLSYVVASALMYTVFGVLAALFGENLQTTFQQPWIIALFSAIFVLLSLSMFGFYNLELPSSIQTKLHNSSVRHQDGSLWGAAIMGALSSLIVGPCVAAPLAGALIFIGQTGSVLLGGSALFAMGLGMGVPLILLGASAGKLLPKAGTWLYSTKAVFGVIMLAVAVWMLSRILPPAVTILLWAALLILPAVYLSALDPLPEQSSGWSKLWKGVGVMMFAYGLILLIGFSLGNDNPLNPLKGFAVNKAEANEEGLVFKRVSTLAELDANIQQAVLNNHPVMVDFYADWCISCKEMEAYTFTNAKVKQALSAYTLLQVDVTKDSADDKAILTRFNLIGPPAILFFNGSDQEDKSRRVIGYQEAETFLKTLQGVKG